MLPSIANAAVLCPVNKNQRNAGIRQNQGHGSVESSITG